MKQPGVSVQLLGTGDAFGSGGRFQTCFLVRSASFCFLIDCGASSLVALRAAQVDLNDVDAILISHLHGDHFGGIPFFMLEAKHVSKRTKPLIVAGPPSLQERTHSAMEVLFPGSTQTGPNFDVNFTELLENVDQTIGPISVRVYPVDHASGAPSYALRVTVDGRIIAFSGDTGWTENLIEVSANADLFICESYYYDKVMKYHLAHKTLLEHRDRFSCKRIIQTHMSEDRLAHDDDGPFERAYDGMLVTL